MTQDDPRTVDDVDEGAPLPLEEDAEPPAFATVRLVDVQASAGSHDTRWHPELAAGLPCPQCHTQAQTALQYGLLRVLQTALVV
jgi:hypothetical protein